MIQMDLKKKVCPACGSVGMKLLSAPRPEYVDQCMACGSSFFNFGADSEVGHSELYQDGLEYQDYLDGINTSSVDLRHREALERLNAFFGDVPSPRLFDVGAGAGNFLNLARGEGFRIAGNEISMPAIEACRQRHGIELLQGDDLALLAEKSGEFDALTMWCVIAHVDDPHQLLSGARKLLRSGGVLFFSTPRYCSIDRFTYALLYLFGDRFRRMFDRRINKAHRRQYSVQGMTALLRREGFVPLSVTPSIGYGLQMERYLKAIGIPGVIAAPMGKVLDYLASSGLAPRNVLNVYAEKP